MNTVTLTVEELELLLSFVPDWAKIVPKGLSAEFYGTLTYDGDIDVNRLVENIQDRCYEAMISAHSSTNHTVTDNEQ